jgi:hypothetical protein
MTNYDRAMLAGKTIETWRDITPAGRPDLTVVLYRHERFVLGRRGTRSTWSELEAEGFRLKRTAGI